MKYIKYEEQDCDNRPNCYNIPSSNLHFLDFSSITKVE